MFAFFKFIIVCSLKKPAFNYCSQIVSLPHPQNSYLYIKPARKNCDRGRLRPRHDNFEGVKRFRGQKKKRVNVLSKFILEAVALFIHFFLSNKDTSLMFPYILIRLVPHYAHLIKNKKCRD
jgi:hypothetical protein